MGLLDKIAKYLSSSSSEDENAYWIYVRCDRCGEQLLSRVNLYNDLSVDYLGNKDQTYHCRKTLVGRTGCFQRIEVKLTFDKNRKLIEHQISGGEFIDESEHAEEDEVNQG
jgi:hypothetical protein